VPPPGSVNAIAARSLPAAICGKNYFFWDSDP
jgi:hypothetical protein